MAERDEPGRQERMLMPSSAPPPEVAQPPTSTRSADGRAARVARMRDARAAATMEGQLGALERDIRKARRATAPPGLELWAHHDHTPRARGEPVRLRDGARIVIRQLGPADAAELKAGFEHLGAVSRYRRFLAPLDHLSDEQVAYLTHVDHTNHEAIAALDEKTGEGIGLARYVRDRDDPQLADVAIVVADAWQGRGVGIALAERLAVRAIAAGVERITARMILGNEPARRCLAHIAEPLAEERRPGTVQVTARLHR